MKLVEFLSVLNEIPVMIVDLEKNIYRIQNCLDYQVIDVKMEYCGLMIVIDKHEEL